MGDAFLGSLKRQLLRQAAMFDHPEDYRAGVEDTFGLLFPDRDRREPRAEHVSARRKRAVPERLPAEIWLG